MSSCFFYISRDSGAFTVIFPQIYDAYELTKCQVEPACAAYRCWFGNLSYPLLFFLYWFFSTDVLGRNPDRGHLLQLEDVQCFFLKDTWAEQMLAVIEVWMKLLRKMKRCAAVSVPSEFHDPWVFFSFWEEVFKPSSMSKIHEREVRR